MKYQLINPINQKYSIIEQILTNRKIPIEEIEHYLNTTDKDINEPELFGESRLKAAAQSIIQNIMASRKTLIICDCDCDGFTSAALLINYLHDLFPSYIETGIKWFMHEDKEHGLNDVMDYIRDKDFGLVICPDAASNDYECHKELREKGIKTIVLDHHLADKISEDAIIINNQLCDYPNKELSGVGVVWQFCRYIDKVMKTNFANKYIDLVALGLTGDMMSLTSIETKHLINKGFEPDNITNPYIYEMWQKNKFKLGEHITSIDAAFYIVPMINAVQRSGTIEEKELLFKSMLQFEAFSMIPSNKRGHKLGEMERVVDQAVRMSTNVKNRQTRAQDAEMELLEKTIEKNNMLEHKALIFINHAATDADKNIAGLIANKLANKYQRPCCILRQSGESYQGSARGYEMSGITNFKDICEEAFGIEWTAGHQNAFGISINKDKIEEFQSSLDLMLASFGNTEPVYYVDMIYKNTDVTPNDILTISDLKEL